MRGARLLSLALGVVATLAPARAAASPEDLFGYGTRTSAMGATGTAHAVGYEAAWHNPALASTIRENKLTLGYGGAVFALDAVGPGLPGRVPTSPATGFFIGGDLPVPFGGRLRDRVGIALAFYTPSDVIVRGRVLYPERPQFPLLGDRAQSLTLRAGLGVDIGWGLRGGVGIAALAEIEGTVVAGTDETGRVGTRVDDQLVATYAPVFGATWDLPAKLRVGLAYRGTLDARFAVIVDGSKLSSIAIPLFNISGIAQYDPAQAAIELARVERLNVLAVQLVYKRWSDFPGLLEPTVVCSEGGPGACGLVPETIAWRDTVVVRAGAERGFDLAPGITLRARGGGFIETSALPAALGGTSAFDVPSKTVIGLPTRYFDSTRVAVTSGVGLSLGRPFPPVDLDLFAQVHLLVPREIAQTVGTSSAVMKGEASGRIKAFGITAGVKF